jgi:uncharacterized membrane protein YgcG
MKKTRDPKSRPRIAPIRGALLAVAFLLVAAAWGANRSAKQGPGHGVVRTRAAAGTATASSRPRVAQAPSASAWRYDAVVQRNLFKPLGSATPGKPGALPPVPPMPVDAFQLSDVGKADAGAATAPQPPQWIYAGYATVNGNPQAIVENSGTKQGQFLTVGQTLDGSVVKSISPQAIQLTRGGDTTEMKLSEAFTATPLNEPPKPAAQPNQGGRGRRGGQGGGQGGGGGGGFGGGGGGGGQFIQRMLRDNPNLMSVIFNQAGGPPGQAPGGGPQPQGGQQ